MYNVILARYGEVGLKGENRPAFETRLAQNARWALKGLGVERIERKSGRLFARLTAGASWQAAAGRLAEVFGLVSVSPARETPLSLDAMTAAAVAELSDALSDSSLPVTFKVEARRSNKSFSLNSIEINRHVGEHLARAFPDAPVDVQRPSITVHVEVREEAAYVFHRIVPGPGGLPVGTSSRALLLISGGIDSPVAGWLVLKRGAPLAAVHFHSPPFTSERAKQKVIDLCDRLAYFGGALPLTIVHFTEVQKAIQKACPEGLRITVMRRIMLRIAERVAESESATALVTGESIGQVASQTLESLAAIEAVSRVPVLRPLIGFDKSEIVALARRIGTYGTSILPYDDCCTLFVPRRPRTRPSLAEAEAAEESLSIDALIDEALVRSERVLCQRSPEFSPAQTLASDSSPADPYLK